MSNKSDSRMGSVHPTIYEIRLKGHLSRQWADWFSGLAVTQEEDGNTLLTGPVADQAALHGLLKRVADLGIPLISVNRAVSSREDLRSKVSDVNAQTKARGTPGNLPKRRAK